jgi:hypothetical protein
VDEKGQKDSTFVDRKSSQRIYRLIALVHLHQTRAAFRHEVRRSAGCSSSKVFLSGFCFPHGQNNFSNSFIFNLESLKIEPLGQQALAPWHHHDYMIGMKAPISALGGNGLILDIMFFGAKSVSPGWM